MSTRWLDMYGYRFPSITDPYVYLKTLENYNNPIEHGILTLANNMLSNISEYENGAEKQQLALDFLKKAANTQRADEIIFLRARINQLKQFDGELSKNLSERLNELTQEGVPFDYNEFLIILNGAMRTLQTLKDRLEVLQDKDNNKNNAALRRDLIKGIDSTVKEFSERRRDFYYSNEELIRNLTLKFLTHTDEIKNATQDIINSGDTGIKSFVAMQVIIQQKLVEYINEHDKGMLVPKNGSNRNYYKDQEDFVNKLNGFNDDFFKRFAEDTNIESVFNKKLLDEAAKAFNIVIEDKIQHRKYKESEKITDTINDLRKAANITDLKFSNSQKDRLRRVTVNFRSPGREVSIADEVGSFFERAISNAFHLGGAGGGTDSIYLGALDIDSGEGDPFEDTLIENAFAHLKTTIYSSTKTANDSELVSKTYQETLKALDQQLEGLQKIFIVHESTKFYMTVEEGTKRSFHGRAMNLFNYIDSIKQFGNGFGIDTDWLNFFAYNLATDALGASAINPLKSFFAIAAGLIMFDDFSVIAKRALDNEKIYNNINSIHLYKLQDLYFPASYFLEKTYIEMEKVADTLSDGMGFKTELSVPTINYYSNEEWYINKEKKQIYKSNYSGATLAERFEQVKNKAKQNTKIQLSFAASFLDLISNLKLGD